MKKAEEVIYDWYAKSCIDYATQYLKLYIAYNAWYGKVTGSNNDRRALTILKKRFMIWRDYIKGAAMPLLRRYIQNIIDCLNENPLQAHRYWQGYITASDDWQSLLEYWYQVRCLIVHGAHVPECHVQLAYQSLHCFMSEIVQRMQATFTDGDMKRLREVSLLAEASEGSEKVYFKKQERLLQQKYIHSCDIWEVDMQPVLINPFTNLEKNAII